MDYDSNSPPQIIIFIAFIVIFITGMVMGSELTESDNINIGRNQGIMFCSEKPEQCKIEYQLVDLKREKQKREQRREEQQKSEQPFASGTVNDTKGSE